MSSNCSSSRAPDPRTMCYRFTDVWHRTKQVFRETAIWPWFSKFWHRTEHVFKLTATYVPMIFLSLAIVFVFVAFILTVIPKKSMDEAAAEAVESDVQRLLIGVALLAAGAFLSPLLVSLLYFFITTDTYLPPCERQSPGNRARGATVFVIPQDFVPGGIDSAMKGAPLTFTSTVSASKREPPPLIYGPLSAEELLKETQPRENARYEHIWSH
ncbi:unnamed protein product [Cyprideis torosa]|uniref:Uncharacterized protein n=1 Tax=Cyprideis torosa TaxID=163714 RepID=A0A7R8WLI8_9CRUS|nr:unnamed protein product [Cyprideis torosa]CAG0902545.1 unnamed protein product [Cyprideis torosa]